MYMLSVKNTLPVLPYHTIETKLAHLRPLSVLKNNDINLSWVNAMTVVRVLVSQN